MYTSAYICLPMYLYLYMHLFIYIFQIKNISHSIANLIDMIVTQRQLWIKFEESMANDTVAVDINKKRKTNTSTKLKT